MKGLEPLIATIILIIIAVVVAATIANWQTWFLPSYSAQLTNQSLSQIQCTRAGLMLDNITYSCGVTSPNCQQGVIHTLTASIRNTGDISLPLYKLYLENTAGRLIEFNLNTTLALDQTYQFTNTSGMDCSGINHSISRITLVTACPSMPSIFDGSIIAWITC
jgi:FlaG/FlaF family flagellin (archaellin)